ncbi:Hemicentin-1 [Oopsacas minuta]|uniref:Hemicentin-1 n=1 Tax=Oopsacas minuta TaxID=111878 RepID=A0AAV7JZE0_9METZ|nr:Hemicentin-1 [Oopsacas minuta]
MKLTYFHFYTLVSYLIFVSSQTLEFTQHPNAVYYTYTGIPLVIQCNSTGDQIIYRRNNVAVRTTTTNQAHTQNSPMVDVDGSAAGVYWDCQTSDNDGEILSSRAIVYWAKFKDSSTSDQIVTVRGTVNSYLPCDFFNGSLPTPVIGWELNGIPIVNPSILPGSNSLLLLSSDVVNGAEYRCFLENRYGDPTDRIQANAQYTLSVVGQNIFSLPPLVFPSTDITSTVGDILHLECVPYAASCSWEYFIEGDWLPVPVVDNQQFPSNLLSVTVTTDTPTLYRAILAGDIQDTRTLTIYQVPEVVSSIEGELIEYELQTISIYCQTSGVPVPTIEMYKDGVLLENGAKYTLTTSGNTTTLEIADLTDSDTGYYTCRADNSEASAVANGRITVRDAVPPSFSQHPTPDFIDAITM